MGGQLLSKLAGGNRLEFALQPHPLRGVLPRTSRFSLVYLGVGHNELRGAVQVVGDGLHDVLRMRSGQSHVPRRAPVKPLAHGAKRALDLASRPANPRVELLLARREPLPAGCPILRRGVALVGGDRDAPGQVGPA